MNHNWRKINWACRLHAAKSPSWFRLFDEYFVTAVLFLYFLCLHHAARQKVENMISPPETLRHRSSDTSVLDEHALQDPVIQMWLWTKVFYCPWERCKRSHGTVWVTVGQFSPLSLLSITFENLVIILLLFVASCCAVIHYIRACISSVHHWLQIEVNCPECLHDDT